MLFNFIVVLSFLLVCCCNARTVDTKDYTIWTIPDTSSDVTVTGTKSGAAMIGGGSDCIPAFSWLIDHAAGGDFVVLRSGGTDAYNQFVYDLSVSLNKTLNSVTTISFKNRDASYNQEVLTTIKNAELIFFSGGDQSNYVNFWKGTPVEDIIQDKMKNQVSIGGTSAGLAIQGEYIFT
jgi:cyanophycinase-like exopeptidase